MNIMLIARYNGQYLAFDKKYMTGQLPNLTEENKDEYPVSYAAKRVAREIFYPDNDYESAGIQFKFVDTFYQPEFASNLGGPYRTHGYGWMAIVDDANYHKLLKAMEYPDGPFCLMYDIEVIPMNGDDSLSEKASYRTLHKVYKHMTPAHWGSGSGGT